MRDVELGKVAGVVFLAVLSAFLFGCLGEDPVVDRTGNNTGANESPDRANKAERVPILGQLPDFTLTDQQGQAFGTLSLSGRYWIANFIFTRCTATCPKQTAQLASLQKRLDSHPHSNDIQLVSITVDPEFDSTAVLQKYATDAQADAQRWKFLTGPRDDVWKLSRDGFKLAVGEATEDPKTPLFHSSKFVLVDGRGRIRGYFDGLTLDGVDNLVATLDTIVKERKPNPDSILNPRWVTSRREKQLKSATDLTVFHEFEFVDRVEESGIRFRNHVVDDAGKEYKANHYDHGNGIAIADVDGDGFSDLYFSTQSGRNALWRNLGDGRFEDVTKTAGVAVADRIGVTASFADIDNDGDADLFVTTVRGGNLLFENDGEGQFADVTASSGLDYAGHSSGAVFFDFDRDGLLDLFVCNVGKYTTDDVGKQGQFVGLKDAFAGHLKPNERNEQSLLYRNLGGNRFEEVSAAMHLEDVSWTGDASPVDFNRDGWPDLYVLSMQGHDEYYQNIGGKKFERKSESIFPHTSWGAMGVKSFDYDGDGDMDLFVTDMHSDMSERVDPSLEKFKANMRWPASLVQSGEFNLQPGRTSIWGNSFFRNDGEGRFEEISSRVGAENYWPWGLSVGDLNADGYEDVFISSSMSLTFRYGVNSLLLNDEGKRFADSEYILGVEPRRFGRTAVPWYECDCELEPEHPDCQGRSGRVDVWGAMGTKSSAIFDLDNDGDLDIVTNEANSHPMVLISTLAASKKPLQYVKIRLVGTKSNRNGLGARITVTTPSSVMTQVYDGVTGYLSHGLYELYFGLDDAKTIESIKVEWPSGQTQLLKDDLRVNTTLVVTEAESQ